MPPIPRVTRAAQAILTGAAISRLPVDVRALARKHAFLMRDPLPPDVSGMLIPAPVDAKKSWIIMVNPTHSIERQRFTIAHELGHLVLHQYTSPHADGMQRVRFRDDTSSAGTDRDEIEANQFAAELLMPEQFLLPRLRELGFDSWDGEPPDDAADAIGDLAAECKVSQQALVIRIANLLLTP